MRRIYGTRGCGAHLEETVQSGTWERDDSSMRSEDVQDAGVRTVDEDVLGVGDREPPRGTRTDIWIVV